MPEPGLSPEGGGDLGETQPENKEMLLSCRIRKQGGGGGAKGGNIPALCMLHGLYLN